jgi:hypothetical protein
MADGSATVTPMESKASVQFIVGRTYRTRSAFSHATVLDFEIVRRSEKSVWFREEGQEKVQRQAIYVYEGAEKFNPFGVYSMLSVSSSPVISAERPVWAVVMEAAR